MSYRNTQAMMIYMHEMVESELSLAITHVTEDSQKTGCQISMLSNPL